MRLRALALATAVGLALPLAPATAHAAKVPTYKVSASISTTSPDVGQSVRIFGKVKGPKAAKKVVLVQRKVGTSAWRTVAKVRTSKQRTYSASVKVSTVGAHQLRVIAPKRTKVAKQGISRTRAFTGWRWLDLTAQPGTEVGPHDRKAVTIAGKTYAKVMTFEGTGIYYNVAGVCSTFTTTIGVQDGTTPSAALLTYAHKTADASDDGVETVTEVPADTTPKAVRQSLAGIKAFAFGAGGGLVTAVAPQVRCTVNRLAPIKLSLG